MEPSGQSWSENPIEEALDKISPKNKEEEGAIYKLRVATENVEDHE